MTTTGVPDWVLTDDIVPAVRRQTGRDTLVITTWSGERLRGAGESLGVWRLQGSADDGGGPVPWSIVLKGWPAEGPRMPPTAWDWPLRELELYRSGILHDLPGGATSPRYVGDLVRPDGSTWIWLEDVTGVPEDPWPLERYGTIARQLGQFNGAYLTGRPVPDVPCLSRSWLRQWVELAAPEIAMLADNADNPVVWTIFPPHVIDALLRLWTVRHAIYASLEQLPQTFCHLDVFRRNIFYHAGTNGSARTVLVDWSFAGIAALGEEIAPLVAASVSFMEVPVTDIRQLEEIVLHAYLDGLRDAGWRGDPEQVRDVYVATVGLRYGVGPVRFIVPRLLDDSFTPVIEQMLGRPIDEITANLSAFYDWLASRLAA